LLLVNIAVLFALVIWAVRGDKDWGAEFLFSQIFWFILLSALWVMFAFLSGLYDMPTMASFSATATALFRTVGLVIFAYLALYFLALPNSLPRLVVFYHGAITVFLIAAWRVVYAGFSRSVPFRRRVIIVGAGWAGTMIACVIRERVNSHYHVIGFVDDDPGKAGQTIEGLRVLGTRDGLVSLVRENGVAEVVLAVTRDLPGEMFHTMLDVQEQGVQITPMSVLYEQITARVPVEHIGDSWYVALPLGHAATGSFYPIVKRILDLTVAAVGLVIFGLMLPLIALAVRLDSPGPLFYLQERVGKGGRVFRVRKLRSMVADAERDGRAVWARSGDPRITRVGKFLRKTRIDEFPQFINILRGEMSAVGPRPERPEFVAQLEKVVPFYRLRHAVKPGMAGWAVVNYDYVDSIESARVRVEYDLYYIKHQSIWLDILILFRTMGQVFALKGR
jgi:exopolysaccharide biosynthesis polyprenyl glycosylphosphotransferase